MRLTLLLITLSGCTSKLVPVVPDGPSPFGGTASAPSDPTFEVVARTAASARDPLPVAGVAYGDLERALGQAVLQNVRPKHDTTLTTELIAADADYSSGKLTVSLAVRATLRTRVGNTFIAQTEVVCRDAAMVIPEEGTAVVWSCMTRLGRDLGGWLDGH